MLQVFLATAQYLLDLRRCAGKTQTGLAADRQCDDTRRPPALRLNRYVNGDEAAASFSDTYRLCYACWWHERRRLDFLSFFAAAERLPQPAHVWLILRFADQG